MVPSFWQQPKWTARVAQKRPEIAAVLSGATYGSALRKSKTLNKELLYVATPVLKSGEIVGIIRISEQTALFSKNIQSFRRYIIFTFGILFLLITLFIFLLLRQKSTASDCLTDSETNA